jgi:prepilin-type N-terminal cleavage/methylation domain-containing protein
MNVSALRFKPQRSEEGFTLIEVMIVVLVMGILSGISVPIIQGHQRDAVISTVKSDIHSSIPSIINHFPDNNLFTNDEIFAETAPVTGDNNLVLIVDGSGLDATACVWGSHIFSEDDIVSFHYDSNTGKIGEGGCLATDPTLGESTVIVGTGPEMVDEHADEPVTNPGAVLDNSVTAPGTTVPVSQPTTAPTTAPTTTNPSGVSNGSVTTPPAPVATTAPTNPIIAEPTYAPKGNKYPVCHESGGKWHLLMLPIAGVVNGHDGHAKDVIPPIKGKYNGKNWNTSGWMTFNKYCV